MEKSAKGLNLLGSASPPGKILMAVEEGSGRLAVRLELLAQGRDYLLLITGGLAHIGAVAVSNGGRAELVVVPGHKEGPLAAECAEAVALASEHTCTALAGIHQDGATKPEIGAIVANVRVALGKVIQQTFSKTGEEQPDDGQS